MIRSPGTYGLSATSDTPGQGGLGNIASITIADTVTGNVDVYIMTQDGTGPGAYDVNMVNLSGDCTATIGRLWITHDLGASGTIYADATGGALAVGGSVLGNVEISDILYPITVDGSLAGNLSCDTLADLTVVDPAPPSNQPPTNTVLVRGDYGGHMNFGGSVGQIVVDGDLTGQIDVAADIRMLAVNGATSGNIHVGYVREELDLAGPVTGTSTVDLGTASNVFLADDLAGTLRFHNQHAGRAAVDGRVTSTGQIELLGGMTGRLDLCYVPNRHIAGTIDVYGDFDGVICSRYGDVQGTITLHGDVAGGLVALGCMPGKGNITGRIVVAGTFGWGALATAGDLNGGQIRILHRLGTHPVYNAAVCVAGQILNEGYVATDWDGFTAADHPWGMNGVVVLGGIDHRESDPGLRIYEITPCRGDMNNDGLVNFADIDPFVAAIQCFVQNPATAAECVEGPYPAHGGSALYHADADGNGLVNFADIDPFVALIGAPCTSGQPLQGGGEQMEMMMEGGSLVGQAALADAIAAAVDSGAGPAGAEYWENVFNSFGEQ